MSIFAQDRKAGFIFYLPKEQNNFIKTQQRENPFLGEIKQTALYVHLKCNCTL